MIQVAVQKSGVDVDANGTLIYNKGETISKGAGTKSKRKRNKKRKTKRRRKSKKHTKFY
jgi:hypothetical protein